MKDRPIEQVIVQKVAELAHLRANERYLECNQDEFNQDGDVLQEARGTVAGLLKGLGPYAVIGNEILSRNGQLAQVFQQRIAEIAYLRAIERRFAPGHELEDWLEAEKQVEVEVKRKLGSNQHFPSIRERVAAIAYLLAEQRAFMQGLDWQDWFMAEGTIEAELEIAEAKESLLAPFCTEPTEAKCQLPCL